jgi:hypothetical protein
MLSHMLRGAAGNSGQLIQFYASSTSSTSTITLPSNLTNKDILILFDFAWSTNSTIPTQVLPSGWTTIQNATDTYSSNETRGITTYIAGNSSLSGTTVTGMSGTGGTRKICVVFRNASFNSVGTNLYDASSNQGTGSLTAGTSPYVALAFVAGSGTASLSTVPSGGTYTPASSGSVLCYYTLNGGAGTYTTNDSGTVTVLKLLTLNLNNI